MLITLRAEGPQHAINQPQPDNPCNGDPPSTHLLIILRVEGLKPSVMVMRRLRVRAVCIMVRTREASTCGGCGIGKGCHGIGKEGEEAHQAHSTNAVCSVQPRQGRHMAPCPAPRLTA